MIVTYSLGSSEIEKVIAEHFGVTQSEVTLIFSGNENVNATVKIFKSIDDLYVSR